MLSAKKGRLLAWPFKYHIKLRYILLVDLVEISFTSLSEAVKLFLTMKKVRGSIQVRDVTMVAWKCLLFIHGVVHFIRRGNYVLISAKLWDEGLIGWKVM